MLPSPPPTACDALPTSVPEDEKLEDEEPEDEGPSAEIFSSYKIRAATKTALLYFGCRQIIFQVNGQLEGDPYYARECDDGHNVDSGFYCTPLHHVVVSFDNRRWFDKLTGQGGEAVDLWAYVWGITRKEAVNEMMETLERNGIEPDENPYLMGHE